MSILQTIDLKKYYGAKPNITRALDGVNFSVEDGEFVAVVGTSGSGKSTLLNMMGGLDTPTSGNIIVRDKELSKMNDEQLTIFRRRNIGFIFQNYNLVPILNVYENIVLPVALDGDMVDKKFLYEIVHLLGLEDKLKNMRGWLITHGNMVLFCDTRRIRQKLPRRIMNRGITDMLAQNLLQRFMRVAFAWKNISV